MLPQNQLHKNERGRIPAAAVRRMGRTVTIDRQALDRTLDQ